LFPDYIECAFLNTYRCEGCGRSGEVLQVLFPSLAWQRDDESIQISYPVRCVCGKAGVAGTKLPFLLFCFICGWLEYQGTSRLQPPQSSQQIRPNESALLSHIVCDFEQVMASYGLRNAASFDSEPTETDRGLFGVSEKGWREFLKRMGFGKDESK
jgi:hypothetical protein